MAVHRRVQFLTRVGLIITHIEPMITEQPNCMASGAIIIVVQKRHFPRALFVTGCQRRCEGMERYDQFGLGRIKPFSQRLVIWPVQTLQPCFKIGANIARYQVPITFRGDHVLVIFLAVHVAYQPADRCQMRGNVVAARHATCNTFDANIERDVLFEQIS